MANLTKKDNILQRSVRFVNESWQELKKCAWPDKQELTKSTIMVLASLAVFTIWIGGLDFIFGLFTKRVIGW